MKYVKQILIIGNYSIHEKCYHFANELEKKYSIFRLATNKTAGKDSAPCDFHILDHINETRGLQAVYDQSFFLSSFNLFSFLKSNEFKPDLIFYFQAHMEIDFSGVNIPVIYQLTECLYPRWPTNANVKILLSTWKGGFDLAKKIHTYQYNKIYDELLVTFGFDSNEFPVRDFSKKFKNQIGFMGGLSLGGGSKDSDYRTRTIYTSRRNYLKFAEKKGCLPRSVSHPNDYVKYLQDCSVTLNISGEGGCINERTFHAPACGSVLLQYEELDYFPLKNIGLIHKNNCLLFHNYRELKECINFIQNNPKEIEAIRKRSIAWASLFSYPQVVKREINKIRRIWNANIR